MNIFQIDNYNYKNNPRLRKYRMILPGDSQCVYDLYTLEDNEKYLIMSVYATPHDVIKEYYTIPTDNDDCGSINEEAIKSLLEFEDDCDEINDKPIHIQDYLEELYESNWCVESIEYTYFI